MAPASLPWRLSILIVVCLCFITAVSGVKSSDFKTCSQSSFCRRNRDLAASISSNPHYSSPYSLAKDLSLRNGLLTATILKSIKNGVEKIELPLSIRFLKSGVAHVTVDEKRRLNKDIDLPEGKSHVRQERYNVVANTVLIAGKELDMAVNKMSTSDNVTRIRYGSRVDQQVNIYHYPFKIEFLRDDKVEMVLNERNLFNVEHWRPKSVKKEEQQEKEGAVGEEQMTIVDDGDEEGDDDGMWEESFNGKSDSKPRGPESIGLDVTFVNYEHVYGIPEHASSFALKSTTGGQGEYSEPYRLYNLDVFEYALDSPSALYGAIPFMYAHRKTSSGSSDAALLWLNAAETWIDISKSEKKNPLHFSYSAKSSRTHWISESGTLDLLIFLGPDSKTIFKQYGELTGYTPLPPLFSIGHHQCRWNYVSEDDVLSVDAGFDEHEIPYDAIWLDIEYTDDKQYFTWDPRNFPHPEQMMDKLGTNKRKLITIIDPHIKRKDGYWVHKEGEKKDLMVKNADGNPFDGWCWPGSSSWVDFTLPKAREWWTSLFKFDKFKSRENVHLWNDMNEPSVFNGPEITMPKDNIHADGWEHRDIHNIYGWWMANATATAVAARTKKQMRPFVLTRSFFTGSQRFGAMWTGDNFAKWDHLEISLPMLLSQGIAGMPFAGADVGGFFGNPEPELLVRWYQAGAFYPFFRAHAHIDTKRREPWLFGEPYTSHLRDALRLRYQLLPAMYTAFHTSSVCGLPILRPQFLQFPDDEQGFEMEDQVYLGDTGILVHPVVKQGEESVTVYLGETQTYYDYFDYTAYKGKGHHTIPAPLGKVPLLVRGGSIIPRKDRLRGSSGRMTRDPYTLLITLSDEGTAEGELYIDDGDSYDYTSGAYIHRKFSLFGKSLVSTNLGIKGKLTAAYLKSMHDIRIERIIVVGVPKKFTGHQVRVSQGGKEWTTTVSSSGKGDATKSIIVRDPKVRVGEDWEIQF